jgi:hypothetical protein
VALLLLLAALVVALGACGDNDQTAPAATRAPSTTTARSGHTWKKIVPGGDCECADGSEFAFWERRADPSKVVFLLDGGGACFDASTCAFTRSSAGGPAGYDWSLWGEDPAREDGIFNFARADNPFRDYSFVYVPSCTGDSHLGDATRRYSPRLTVEHRGFVNGTAALDHLAEQFPDANQVVVVGRASGRWPPPSLAASLPTGCPAPRSPRSAPSRATSRTIPTSMPGFSVSCGAPTTTCPTGRSMA